MPTKIVVVGAGVTGLTTALLLSRDKGNAVTIVAKHMPGDYDIEYASPFAGANVLPMLDEANSRWERRTWPELQRICKEVPEAGIHFQKVMGYRRDKDLTPEAAGIPMDPLFDRNPWYKHLLPGYEEMPKNKVIPGFDSAFEFQSLCINTAVYLAWLVGQCLKNGVVLKRAILSDINEAKSMSHTAAPADIIVNATGLGALKLGGVLDTKMAPARGQTVLVRNECTPMTVTSGTEDGATEIFYVMQRAGGGGTILGGTYDIGNWESNPDPNIANRIMKRAVDVCPQLTNGKGPEALSVIRHAVGLRPYRTGGVRIEREQLADGTHVVHNYGHAGWGYQGSYGAAERAIELVNEIRRGRGEDVSSQTKLFAWDDGKNPAFSKRTSKL